MEEEEGVRILVVGDFNVRIGRMREEREWGAGGQQMGGRRRKWKR